MPERPTCHCGYDRYHHHVRPSLSHGLWAWVILVTGASATPREVRFRCSQCGETFEVTRDPEVLRAFRRYPNMPPPEDLP